MLPKVDQASDLSMSRFAFWCIVVSLGCLIACAALDKFFGGQPGDLNTSPENDLVNGQGGENGNEPQPMFLRKADASAVSAASQGAP